MMVLMVKGKNWKILEETAAYPVAVYPSFVLMTVFKLSLLKILLRNLLQWPPS